MIRLRQIQAVFVRDLRIQLSYPFHIISQLIGMALSLFSIFFLGRLVGSSPLLDQYEGGYFEFALIGLVVVVLAGAALRGFNSGLSSEGANGTLEILLASPLPLPALVTGWIIWPLFLATIEAGLTFGLGWIFAQGAIGIAGLVMAMVPFALTVGSFLAVGLVAGAFTVITKRGDVLTPLYMGASTLLAGALYPVEVLPDWLASVARLLPAFYGFNAMRDLLIGSEPFSGVAGDIAILVGFNLVLIPLGMWTLRRALRFARVTGTLATN